MILRNIKFWLLLLIIFAGLFFRLWFVHKSLPYPGHVDEAAIAENALEMIQTGSLNPGFFNYPSLTIYLTAFWQKFGFLLTGAQPQDSDITVSYPYYHPMIVMALPRYFFAGVSVLVIVFVSLVGYYAFRKTIFLVLSPVLVLLVPKILYLSWRYINVDILGVVFVTGALFFLFSRIERHDIWSRGIIPGILCGCAIASKYTLGLILLPFLIHIWLNRRQPFLETYLLLGTTILTFVILVPYSVLDFPIFRHNVLYEIRHYQSGHPGSEGEPGISQLIYYISHMIKNFGSGAMLLSVSGIIYLLRQSWQRALIFLSFPLSLLFYMSLQTTHFLRNIVSVLALWPVIITFGVIAFAAILQKYLYKIADTKLSRFVSWLLPFLLIFFTLPFQHIAAAYTQPADSRKRLIKWIQMNAPENSTIALPERLAIDTGPLKNVHIKFFQLGELPVPDQSLSDLYYIIPDLDYNPIYPVHEQKIKEWENIYSRSKAIHYLPGEAVRLLEHPPVASGNPGMTIYKASQN